MTANGPRPFGVTIVGILVLLSGVANIILGILGFLSSNMRAELGVWAIVATLLIGIIYLLVASGIFNGNRGSRLLVAIITVLNLIAGVLALTAAAWTRGLVQVAVSLIILVLLYGANARRYFG